MHDLLSDLLRWRDRGEPVAVARVVQTYGSSPRPVGAKMLVSASGEMAGSVSGGCVEGAVAQESLEVLTAGAPRLVEYGIADELAQSVGLTCGGIIHVLIEPLAPEIADAWQHAVSHRQPLAVVSALSGGQLGTQSVWTPSGWQHLAAHDPHPADLDHHLNVLLRGQHSARVHLPKAGALRELFFDIYTPPPQLIIVGAVHIAIPLVTIARALGFYTIVLDARAAFATPARFGHADQLVVQWPADALADLSIDASTYLVLLTHDEKIDNPVLAEVISSPARYIGALGGETTHAKRVAQLQQIGLSPQQIARIHAPIGLDLGGGLPEEIALAIVAEMVAVRNGASLMDRTPSHTAPRPSDQ